MSIGQLSSSVVVVKRFCRKKQETVLLISHTAFNRPSTSNEFHWEHVHDLSIDEDIQEILLESSLKHFYDRQSIETFERSPVEINGLVENELYLRENINVDQSRFIRLANKASGIIEFLDTFRPGSIVVVRLSTKPSYRKRIERIENNLTALSNKSSSLSEVIDQLTLADLNRVLYRSSSEEKSDGKGFDVYQVPNQGAMIYAGIQGQMNVLDEIRRNEDYENNPLIDNLRQGDWLLDYVVNRLKVHSSTKALSDCLSTLFDDVRSLSRTMLPVYFELVLRRVHESLIDRTYVLMNSFASRSSNFVRSLCQTSVQLVGFVRDARLPNLSSNIQEAKPQEEIDEQTFERVQLLSSLAAGLPHFSSGIWRNWGRDTFISLRGLLLLTGRFDEARYLILSYGQCLRHGLIPNLLGDGKIARYNARDAVWWWIYSISNYTTTVPDGHEILTDRISRFYPTNESPMQPVGAHEQMLYDVIHEVLLRHGQSLNYRERGAGHSLDSDMKDEGFNNEIGLDFKSGFVFGGNRWNCGTWMDKMGSSERAGNKGHPATPRDGSAVELIGLSRSIVGWLVEMNRLGYYPYDSIETASSSLIEIDVSSRRLTVRFLFSGSGGKTKLLFTDWAKRIDENFEKYFWIDENDSSQFVNRRSIYKDTINSSFKWSDFQLRPNFLVAAVLVRPFFHVGSEN